MLASTSSVVESSAGGPQAGPAGWLHHAVWVNSAAVPFVGVKLWSWGAWVCVLQLLLVMGRGSQQRRRYLVPRCRWLLAAAQHPSL